MKADDQRYTFDELARNDSFRRWVVERDKSQALIWEDWVSRHPDQADTVTLARAFLLALEEKDTAFSPDQLDQLTDQVLQTSPGRVVPLWRRSWLRVAASVLLLAGAGYGILVYQQRPDSRQQATLSRVSPALLKNSIETVNTSGLVQAIKLADGSTVRLYPNSRLRYPNVFGTDRREVYLSGQAFFSVQKDARRPFWVYTDKLSTQVLGTSFLVSAFTHQPKASVAVRSGRVSVYRMQDIDRTQPRPRQVMEGVILTPNQQVAYSSREERLIKSVVPAPVVVQPAPSAAFVFNETPVADVFALLEKTYGIPVIYDRKATEDCFITANLTGESLTQQLELITKVSRSTFELVDGQIVIHSRGCETK